MNGEEVKTENFVPQEVGFWKSGSTGMAIVSLAKNTLGAGILGLSIKTMYAGAPLFLLLLTVAAFFTVKSIEFICLGATRTGKFVYEEITESLYGRGMGIFLGVAMLLNCYGASIVYVCTLQDSFSTLLSTVKASTGDNWPVYATLILGGTVLVPLSVFEKINSLRGLSLAGVIGVFFTVATIVYALCVNGVSTTLTEKGNTIGNTFMTPLGGFIEMMTVMNILVFAFCNQFNVPQIFGEMVNKSKRGVMKLALVSTGLALGLYFIASICGYLAYGLDIEGDIINNYTNFIEAGNAFIIIGVSAVTLSVSMCHLLNNFPMRLSVLYFLPAGHESNKWIKLGVPIFTAVTTIGFALWYSDMAFFLGFVGALTGSIIGYIVPALFSIRVSEMDKYEALVVSHGADYAAKQCHCVPWYKKLLANPFEYLMILVGTTIGIVGTYCEVYNAVNKD